MVYSGCVLRLIYSLDYNLVGQWSGIPAFEFLEVDVISPRVRSLLYLVWVAGCVSSNLRVYVDSPPFNSFY